MKRISQAYTLISDKVIFMASVWNYFKYNISKYSKDLTIFNYLLEIYQPHLIVRSCAANNNFKMIIIC